METTMKPLLIIVYLFIITQLYCSQTMSSSIDRSMRHSESTRRGPLFSVYPNAIDPRKTYKFTAECSVDGNDIQKDESIVSLLISFKRNHKSRFNVQAVISSTDYRNPIRGENFTGNLRGNLDEKKGGFLKIEVVHPNENVEGEYKCQMSKKSKFLLFSATSSKILKVTRGVSLWNVMSALDGLRSMVSSWFNKLNETDTRMENQIDTILQNQIDHIHSNTKNNNWITIQRRANGDVDFYRYWSDYKRGFGNPKTNFWLGLDKIHELTKNGAELKVILKYKGKTAFAHYLNFSVGDEESKYKLSVSGYNSSSTAGNSLMYHNGMQFSTRERDNDRSSSTHCAKTYGGFWHNRCHRVNINGKWGAGYMKGLRWMALTGANTATYSEMLVKKKI